MKPLDPDGGGICAGVQDTHPGVTIVTCKPGKRACKVWRSTAAGPRADPPDYGYLFQFKATGPIAELSQLEALIRWCSGEAERFIVRGYPTDPDRFRWRRRTALDRPMHPASLRDVAGRVLGVDIDDDNMRPNFDNPEATVRAVVERLGWEGTGVVWQWSGSAGFKPGVRLHLWTLLSAPVPNEDLRLWAKDHQAQGFEVDHALYNPVQPHLCADPKLVDLEDPTGGRRLGVIDGGLLDATPWHEARRRRELARELAQAEAKLRAESRARHTPHSRAGTQGPGGHDARRRALLQWLDDACDEIMLCPQGSRHITVRERARYAGRAVGAGLLDRSHAIDRLCSAVSGYNNPSKHCVTIEQAVAYGIAFPLEDRQRSGGGS